MQYYDTLNNFKKNEIIDEMEEYAHLNNVPIITKDGLSFLLSIIKMTKSKNILEVGTAIGFSSSMIALQNENYKVDTIERNEKMEELAKNYIQRNHLENQVNLIFGDALEIDNSLLMKEYDLIFIDAAKAQYINFFEKYCPLLKKGGIIVSDNLLFHGLIEKQTGEESRDLKQLIRKIKRYNDWLKNNELFDTSFLRIGDGIAISIKK